MADEAIPADCGVSVELQIPQTSKRIDFIVAGQDEGEVDRAVIVELKQWEAADPRWTGSCGRSWAGPCPRPPA